MLLALTAPKQQQGSWLNQHADASAIAEQHLHSIKASFFPLSAPCVHRLRLGKKLAQPGRPPQIQISDKNGEEGVRGWWWLFGTAGIGLPGRW